MNTPNFLRKPLIAALLGAATIAAPVSALYMAGAGRAIATPSTTPTQPTPAAPSANLAAQLPDFSSHGAALRPGGREHRGGHQGHAGGRAGR